MAVLERELGDDGVAVLTLNRPEKKNALSIELLTAIDEAIAELADDAGARVIVITGAGGTFSAGFDLTEMTNAERLPDVFEISTRYHRTVWSCPKPTIAAIDGPALGGGFDLSVLCDLRVASESASFGHPEIKFGAPPLFTPLRWIVGDGLARDLCLTGRRIDGEEAERIGLVSRVVEAGKLLDEATATARQIAEAPDPTLLTTKRYMTGNAGLGFEESFRAEHDDVFQAQIEAARGFAAE